MMQLNIFIGIAVIVILLIVIFLTCYVKAPPSYAYVLSGIKKEPRLLVGSGGVKIPIFERLDKVYLGQLTVDVKTERSVPTQDFINVNVDAVAKVAVTTTPEGIRLAARNFLNMKSQDIAEQLQDNLQGNLRELIGGIDLKSLNIDRDGFSNQVMEKAQPDMSKLGISILAFNVQNIKDENGLIENLGADNTWKIRKDAAITKAVAEKDIALSQAENAKLANDAKVEADTAIAEKNTDLALKKAELQTASDTAQAKADAAYDIQKQEQQLIINEKTIAAETAKTVAEQKLTEQKIAVTKNQLDSEIVQKSLADKIKTETDAAAEKAKKELDAAAELEQRKRKAEAELYEAEKQAAAKQAKAEADKYAKLQEAEGIKAVGEAEAAAIQAKAEAEAQGMEKKAEAYQKYNDAAMASMVIEKLPQIAQSISEQVAAIDGINIYGSGSDGSGLAGITSNLPIMLAQTFDTVKSATGIDVPGLISGSNKKKESKKN